MKLADIGDFVAAPHKSGRRRNVGNWSFVDSTDCRTVYHYGTLMGAFILNEDDLQTWEFAPTSVGWGSVSDQQGMNKILANYSWRYRRNGGVPRYEEIR
jgi:hypothetical protein